jgi:hypothetical protein
MDLRVGGASLRVPARLGGLRGMARTSPETEMTRRAAASPAEARKRS